MGYWILMGSNGTMWDLVRMPPVVTMPFWALMKRPSDMRHTQCHKLHVGMVYGIGYYISYIIRYDDIRNNNKHNNNNNTNNNEVPTISYNRYDEYDVSHLMI